MYEMQYYTFHKIIFQRKGICFQERCQGHGVFCSSSLALGSRGKPAGLPVVWGVQMASQGPGATVWGENISRRSQAEHGGGRVECSGKPRPLCASVALSHPGSVPGLAQGWVSWTRA